MNLYLYKSFKYDSYLTKKPVLQDCNTGFIEILKHPFNSGLF